MGDLLTIRLTDGAGRPVQPRRFKLMTREGWARVVELMASHVIRRTSDGLGADGQLAPYDLDTTTQTGQAGPARLTRTGRMLRTLERVADDRGASVRPTVAYARFHVLGTRYTPPRDFLAVDDALADQVAVETVGRIKATVSGRAEIGGALASAGAEPSIPEALGPAL